MIDFQNHMATYNPLGLCKFMVKGGLDPTLTVGLVNAAMGWDWTADDLVEVGERLFNLKRLVNLRLGITPEDDTLPSRFLNEPRPSGTAEGNLPDLDALLPLYYRHRGWDAKGRPTAKLLESLGLSEEG